MTYKVNELINSHNCEELLQFLLRELKELKGDIR